MAYQTEVKLPPPSTYTPTYTPSTYATSTYLSPTRRAYSPRAESMDGGGGALLDEHAELTSLVRRHGTVRLENKLHSVLGELASCKSSLAHERGDNMRLREASVMKEAAGEETRAMALQVARFRDESSAMQRQLMEERRVSTNAGAETGHWRARAEAAESEAARWRGAAEAAGERVRAAEAEGQRMQREAVSGLGAEVDYLTQQARRTDAQLHERERDVAEAAAALRDEAGRARLLEEELMRCQVMLRRAEEVAEERAALYAERAAKHDAAEVRCRDEQRRVMAAEVELADFKAAASTEMGRARSLHETLTAQLEAAAAELTSREGAAVGLTARLAAAAEEAQAQRGAAGAAAKAGFLAAEQAACAAEDRDSALSEVAGLQDLACAAQAKLTVVSEELVALKLETGSFQALLELARDEVKKLTADRDAAERALSKQAILMQHHIAEGPMASMGGGANVGLLTAGSPRRYTAAAAAPASVAAATPGSLARSTVRSRTPRTQLSTPPDWLLSASKGSSSKGSAMFQTPRNTIKSVECTIDS